MASQTWTNLLNAGAPWQTSNGTLLTTSASSATISPQAPTTQDFVLPGQPNGLQWYPGMTLLIKAAGTLNSGGTASNLTWWLAAGGSGATTGTTVATPGLGVTGALALGTGSLTGVVWRLDSILRCLAVGSTGNTLSYGGQIVLPVTVGSNSGSLATPTANSIVMAIPETVTAFSTYTSGTALFLRAALSAAFGGVQCNQFTIEQLG